MSQLWADAYTLFSKVMDLGIKELYSRELPQEAVEQEAPSLCDKLIKNPLSAQLKNRDTQSVQNTKRDRRMKLLKLTQQEASRTQLRARANRIFNSLLKDLDGDLHKHIQKLDMQPELILLRWLRCLMVREFDHETLLYVWDFIFSGVHLGDNKVADVNDESFYTNVDDNLANLDFICLAMITSIRKELLVGDFMHCLQTLTNFPCRSEPASILARATRIRTIQQRRRKVGVINTTSFPMRIE